MKNKRCSLCKKVKPTSEFYVMNDRIYPQCKECKRAKDKNSYHTNDKERARRIFSEKNAKRIRQLKAQIFAYGILVNSKCVDCGESRLETLEFDHVRDTKTKNVSLMVLRGLNLSIIEKEISKCEVRCANCHRIKTGKQLGWARATWNIEEANLELAECIERAPKRKTYYDKKTGERKPYKSK